MAMAQTKDTRDMLSSDKQYLTFRLDGQEYGISILKIQEIKGWDKVTPIPNSPEHIKGVLNLRGVIVPVIDLRLRFGLKEAERDVFTVIIVANVGGRLAGIVVDAVSDVINIDQEHMCETPEFDGYRNREFIKGLAQIEGKLLVLLNIDLLVNPDSLEQAVAPAAAVG